MGFLYDDINYNFYDSKELLEKVTPFIIHTLQEQIALGTYDVAILLGTGKNQQLFSQLNEKHHFFKKVFVLEHPRFIMQYKRKEVDHYLEKYIALCEEARKMTQ